MRYCPLFGPLAAKKMTISDLEPTCCNAFLEGRMVLEEAAQENDGH
jgi:hypothetical protein